MAKFTTRIELRDGTDMDYEVLDEAMLKEGFTKTLMSEDNSIFVLPKGEYNFEKRAVIKEIFVLAEKASATTGKKFWILISETVNRMWKLPETFF